MTDFINGKLKFENEKLALFYQQENAKNYSLGKKEFSLEAKAVFDAGRELWKYYHEQKGANVNASLYDIREHFQGRNPKGRMNPKSQNQTYNQLISNLREKLNLLAEKITPKVYEYEFLME